MKVAGLTGGMGSGKTTVAGFFRELGVPVYIADEAGKRLMDTSAEVKSQIIQVFGDEAYSEGKPNRKYIAAEVFNAKEQLEKLNNIVHPAVARDFEEWKNNQTAAYVIYEAAILLETGGESRCDMVILVTAPMENRIQRLQKRDQSTVEEIEARLKHQWSDEKKRALAHFEIKNDDLSSTKEQVRNIQEIILKAIKN
ncbi:dephospho-CoA kinase [Gillisia limnaea]|uniref:Dephospho-CoA kinase n=1 Tax=Gillisia limnaea (strain DSM 15749 / LMG 21470 / R-8282) TaxID=865937 RepID=H2BT85_GILLR|nr:dephospho-CoA kinase [Gillisia limnaea]EHQ03684.1 Dephospho-CoA kinase [Gillisia limnaea DSM 15749]